MITITKQYLIANWEKLHLWTAENSVMIPQWPESQKVALADRIIHALRKHLPEIQRLPKWRRLPQLEAENKAANLFVILR